MRPIPFYREDQRRGYRGRWITEGGGTDEPKPTTEAPSPRRTQLRQQAEETLQQSLADAELPQHLADSYGQAFRQVLDSLTVEGLRLFNENCVTVTFWDSILGVDHDRQSRSEERGVNPKKGLTVGFLDRRIGDLCLDGGQDPLHTVHVYAHEMGHVLDGKGADRYSLTPAWGEAWLRELVWPGSLLRVVYGHFPLSRYARTSPGEGWAEFHRALVVEPEVARKRFPLCYQCWQERGLV
jgi:hypothetical protein